MAEVVGAGSIVIVPCKPVEADAIQVMDWRNDPVTQSMFFRPGKKVWPDFYREFVNNYFNDSELPPVFASRQGELVAFLAFKRVPHPAGSGKCCVDISINVAPTERGRGTGAAALRAVAQFLAGRQVETVLAVIRESNTASQRAFESVGFRPMDTIAHHVAETGETCQVRRYLLDLV